MSDPLAHAPRRELYVRHALLEGRSVALLRAVDEGHRCVVEAEVWPADRDVHPYAALHAGPYVFSNVAQATQFVTQAVEALIALGCEVRAS